MIWLERGAAARKGGWATAKWRRGAENTLATRAAAPTDFLLGRLLGKWP